MPSWRASSSSNASRRSAASRPSNEFGIVCLLDGARDRDQAFGGGDRLGQVFRIGVAGLVEGFADGRPQTDRRQAGGQRVDRHDPAGVQELGLAHLARDHLELGVVEGQATAEVLELPGHDHLGADVEPPFDEAAPEPGRVDRARVVLETGDRPLGPTPEARLDPDVTDRRLDGHHVAVRYEDEVAELAHLAQVVVPPRQVEEQVADGVEVEPDPGPPEGGPGGQPGLRQWGRQQLDRVGRGRSCRARRLRHAYSAAIRYR